MELTKSFKVKGKWWLPDKKDKFCLGELEFTPGQEINLRIYGSLIGTKNIHDSKANFRLEEIHGQTQDGKYISCIGAFGHETGTGILLESQFEIDYLAICSDCLLDIKSDKFTNASLHFNCSNSFFHSLYKPITQKRAKKSLKLTGFKFNETKTKDLYRDESQYCYLYFGQGSNMSKSKDDDLSFRQNVYLNLVFNNGISFKEIVDRSTNIKHLFSFFSIRKIFFTSLRLKESSTGKYFEIIFLQNNKSAIHKLSSLDLLLTYREIRPQFKKIISWWLKNDRFVQNGLSLYMQLLNVKIESPPQQFLSIVFALETMHVNLFDKPLFSKRKNDKFLNQKKKFTVDNEFKKRMNECLSHFNCMTFSMRLTSMIDKNAELFKSYIYNIPDFIRRVKRQRNYYAHDHSDPSKNLIEISDFDYFIYMCQLVYDVTFLHYIGLSKENIKLLVKKNFFFQYYKENKPSFSLSNS